MNHVIHVIVVNDEYNKMFQNYLNKNIIIIRPILNRTAYNYHITIQSKSEHLQLALQRFSGGSEKSVSR